jgi:hypothetical protein
MSSYSRWACSLQLRYPSAKIPLEVPVPLQVIDEENAWDPLLEYFKHCASNTTDNQALSMFLYYLLILLLP